MHRSVIIYLLRSARIAAQEETVNRLIRGSTLKEGCTVVQTARNLIKNARVDLPQVSVDMGDLPEIFEVMREAGMMK